MNPRIDDPRLDERLREFLSSQADLVTAMAAGESEMAERVGARVSRRHFDQRLMLLVAAALLVALTAATAIALGSGLLRLPWTSDPLPVAGGPPCTGFEPSETLVLDYGRRTQGNGSPSGYFELSLDTAGRLIGGPSGGSAGLTIRLLSPRGVQLMIDQVRQAPFGTGCRSVDAGTSVHFVYTQTAAGLQGVDWSPAVSRRLRPTTPADRSAALALQERLDHIELWMPTDGWIDATARPFAPQRWNVYIQWSARQAGDPRGPDSSTFRMPDGSPLANYGTALQVHPLYRCAVASTPFVNALLARLTSAGVSGRPAPGKVSIFTDSGGANNIDVVINALRPHEPDCVEQALAPNPSPTADASDPLAAAQPCDFLPDESVSDALGVLMHGESHLSALRDPYRDCVFFPNSSPQGGGAILDLRRTSTSDLEARQLTRELFGGTGLMEEELAGHVVYMNGCYRTELSCTPAIAIAAEPYYLVVSVGRKGDQATLETLALAVIENLPPK